MPKTKWGGEERTINNLCLFELIIYIEFNYYTGCFKHIYYELIINIFMNEGKTGKKNELIHDYNVN